MNLVGFGGISDGVLRQGGVGGETAGSVFEGPAALFVGLAFEATAFVFEAGVAFEGTGLILEDEDEDSPAAAVNMASQPNTL